MANMHFWIYIAEHADFTIPFYLEFAEVDEFVLPEVLANKLAAPKSVAAALFAN